MESSLITIICWLCEPFALKWISHGSSQISFSSIRPMFSVTCGLNCFLSIVVGYFCVCCFYFLQQIFILFFTLPYF